MLADHVTAEGVEAPRNLEKLDLHFEAGDWAANGVLLLEADGDVCASGTGGDASDGDYSASWDAPKDGCYRVDAHSAGEACGFSSPVSLNIDWCAGRTETLKYTPGADGWTALGVFPFHPGHYGGVTQKEGAVDAFRVVPVQECEMGNPVFGSITVDTDADEMPEDLASQLADRVAGMGDALTAFFHPLIEENRRLSVGEKPTNHVVVDFDMSKLGAPYTPTEAAVKEAAQLICGMLDTVECGHAASFKLDESGDVKKLRGKPTLRDLVYIASALLIALSAVGIIFIGYILARKHCPMCRPEPSARVEPKPVFVTPTKDCEDAVEEKKPQVEDDNVSTVTPVSLPDSLPSVDDTAAEQQV
jgi:hypothetical protein